MFKCVTIYLSSLLQLLKFNKEPLIANIFTERWNNLLSIKGHSRTELLSVRDSEESGIEITLILRRVSNT